MLLKNKARYLFLFRKNMSLHKYTEKAVKHVNRGYISEEV